MLYFKTIDFRNKFTQSQVETALRKSAIKKTTFLDFKSSIIDVNRNKDFLGFESKTSLSFTRTKTSLEFLLPKLILNLPKEELAVAYKIRLGMAPFCVFLVISLGVLTVLVSFAKGINNLDGAFFFFTGAILFLLLLVIELKITESRVLKSIKNLKD